VDAPSSEPSVLLLPIPLILPSGTFKSSIRCNLGGHLSSSSSVLSILTERFTHIEGAVSTGDGSEGARMPPPQLIKEFDWPRRSATVDGIPRLGGLPAPSD
jgi:hypothetical protein